MQLLLTSCKEYGIIIIEREVTVMRFEIKVFGRHFEDIEDFGGWQLIWAGFDVNAAKVALMGLIPHYGEDNLDWNF